ncbi:MAG: flagellin [Alphaproteobacteria bacterium]
MLSKSARSTLLQLANNTTLIGQTQQRLSSGRKFNSVIEGGADYLKARGFQKTAEEFIGYKQNMDDGLSVIKGTMEGMKSSKSMLQQLRSIAEDAQDGSLTEALATSRAGSIVSQYDGLLGDIGLQGVNLVDGSLSAPAPLDPPYDPALLEETGLDVIYSNFRTDEAFEYGEELFVRGYDNDTSTYKLLSYDGSAWTDKTADTGFSNFWNYDFYEYDGKLLMRGRDMDTNNSGLIEYDGTNWTNVSKDLFGFTNMNFLEIQELNGEIFATGRNYEAPGGSNVLKYDGTTWTDVTTDMGASSFDIYHAFETEAGVFISGRNYDINSQVVLKYDGTNFVDITASIGNPAWALDGYMEYNGITIIHGEDGWDNIEQLLTYDGTSWTKVSEDIFGISDFTFYDQYSAQYDNGILAAGYDQDSNALKLLHFDGTNWTDTTASMGVSSFYFNGNDCSKGFGDEVLIGIKDSSINQYKVLSYDGTSWTDVTADTGYSDLKVDKFYEQDGILFAKGYDATSSTHKLLSYDGTTWTDLTESTGFSNLESQEFYESGGEMFIKGRDMDTLDYKVLHYDGTTFTDMTLDMGASSFTSNLISEFNGTTSILGVNNDTGEKVSWSYDKSKAMPSPLGEFQINLSANTNYGVNTKDFTSTSIDLDIATLDFTAAGAADTIARIDTAIDQMEVYER